MLLKDGAIHTRSNNLNLIRLLAATCVTFGHSFIMFKGSPYKFFDLIQSGTFGFYAVAVFFGLSGFLITQSYVRTPSWKSFLKARLLRLAPGLLFANFVAGLIVTLIVKMDWTLILSKNFFVYLLNGSFKDDQTFPNTFAHLHFNSTNGVLWTLPHEFRMYLFVLFLGLITFLKKRSFTLILASFLLFLAFFKIDPLFNIFFPVFFKVKGYDPTWISLPLSFTAGILAFLYMDKFKLIMPVALSLLAISFFVDSWFLTCLSWIYFMLCFGYDQKYYLPKLNFKNDISYGVYILSWPIQQCVLHLKWANSELELFFMSMAFIIPLSIISWKFVEKPSLKWKKY